MCHRFWNSSYDPALSVGPAPILYRNDLLGRIERNPPALLNYEISSARPPRVRQGHPRMTCRWASRGLPEVGVEGLMPEETATSYSTTPEINCRATSSRAMRRFSGTSVCRCPERHR
jgi:hypothetical protein